MPDAAPKPGTNFIQDIIEADCIAEGIEAKQCFADGDGHSKLMGPIWAYQNRWEQINGKGSWTKNPWVWCYEFRKLKP